MLDIYLRSVISGCALFLFLFTVPILAKWILIGRWKPKQIRIWSLAYVRFWIVKTLVRRNPIVLFTGSPLFTLYLRALGAKVGRGVVIFSTHVPICTDLLTIGEGTVIRKDCFINGYRAHAGFIQVGAITIGKNAVISEATVIDIDTSMGDGTQLGHASSLHSGQAVPDGQRWHGTPGQQTEADFLTVEPAPSGTLRRAAYAIWQLLTLLLVYLPVGIGGSALLLLKVPRLSELMGEGTGAFTSWTFYRDALVVSSVLFFGSVVAGFVIVMTVPRAAQSRAQTRQALPPVRLPLRDSSVDRAFLQCQVLEQHRSATARGSCTTCAASGTTSERSSRWVRTSAAMSSTRTRS